jgi:hypothetical protein
LNGRQTDAAQLITGDTSAMTDFAVADAVLAELKGATSELEDLYRDIRAHPEHDHGERR